ncbi:leucine-rich repeat domain-containing protein, partial [bacterium]|nr:leucine-rich repeat domain-containing protein [bacterium]
MQKILSFFVVLFSFLSLSADWGEELCEDQTCSGHGECQDDGENEWCVCDEGYIADGLDCILGCNGVTCSGHGVCSVVSGAEVCTCEAGFSATGLNCILNEASTVDTLAILNETECYNTGNCHYRLIFATGAYSFTPAISSLYDIIVNVLDSENVWHNYRKTVAQCVTEGVCDNVDAQYIDFRFQHSVNGNQYVTVELLGNGDDASDDMYHDVLINYCYGVDCGSGGSCDGTSGYPVCTCEEGYVLRGGICEEGWFEDENLAAAVVELLQYKGYDVETETDIEPEMLSDIESLPLKGKNISSLVGIGLFSSLSTLDISDNNIHDLSPLADCTGLQALNISGNPANDLSPLIALPLFSIDISYSGVYNLNPLVSVTSLGEIIFAGSGEGRHGIIRPGSTSVPQWLAGENLTGCNELSLYDMSGSRVGKIEINTGCSVHGSCVLG